MEKTRKSMMRKFYATCTEMGVDESSRRAMIESCGVTSSRDLTAIQLIELIDGMKKATKLKENKKNQARRRLMASIYEYGKAIGTPFNEAQVKAIMCRGGEVDHVNDIPLDKLAALYNSFINRKKALDFVD
jgi:hypothetical protein